MEIRGERECKDCGAWWSYYETGAIACPECGSLQSVGTDERTRHTASAATLDLSAARECLDPGRTDASDTREAAERAAEVCGEFVRGYGFIHAGELRELDDTYRAALTLRYVAEELARTMRMGADEERYFLALLAGADRGERPDSADLPESFRAAHGLACAEAVREYRRDAKTYLKDHPDPVARAAFGTLAEYQKRVQALDGDVAPETADRLVKVACDLGTYLRAGEEGALSSARERLGRFG